MNAIITSLTNAVNQLISFIPQFIGGILILAIGFLVAALLRMLVIKGLNMINFDQWMRKAGIKGESKQQIWIHILAQLVYWTVVIVFLIPAVEAWGIPQLTRVINQFLAYLPNVFAAIIIGFVGMIIANLFFEIVENGGKNVGMANVARYAIIIFTVFVVLTQLGVAANLIQILFTGIVATFAIGLGLAIGLGGQDTIRQLSTHALHSKTVQAHLPEKKK